MNSNIFPTDPKACAILAALEILQQAGINPGLNIEADASAPFSIRLRTVRAPHEIRHAMTLALEHQRQVLDAVIAVQRARQGDQDGN